MTDRFRTVFGKQLLQVVLMLAQLRAWLLGPPVYLLGYITADDLLDGVLGNMKLTGYLPDRFLVPVVGLANFTD